MNHHCDKCSSKLIKKSSNNYGCPGCHSQFEFSDSKLIRTAQFGGNIARPNISGPGSSPLFDRTTNRSRGTNTRFETSFDSIISRTHNPAPLDPERNMEKRLEQFHNNSEEDLIPYTLTPKERQRLKIRKEIRRREEFYENAAKKVDENTVEYIKKNFHPTEQQMQTLDQSLASERKYEDVKPKSIYEERSPEQIKPERRHSLAKMKGTTVFDDVLSETDSNEPNYNPNLLTSFLGIGVYGAENKTQKELDSNLFEKAWNLMVPDNTNSLDFPQVDEGYGSNYITISNDDLKSFELDPDMTSLEEALRMNDKDDTSVIEFYLPQIKSPSDVNIDKYTGEGKEPRSIFTKYPMRGNPFGSPPLPK